MNTKKDQVVSQNINLWVSLHGNDDIELVGNISNILGTGKE